MFSCLKKRRYMGPDRLSCLPDHIIYKILSFLPIKDAGRTSVLSSQWSKKWTRQSNLEFDTQCVYAASSKDPSVMKIKFFRIIDHVLLLHSGPINKVTISDNGCHLKDMRNSVADFDRWILHLTGRSIKELVLYIWLEQRYKMPWCLFSCQSLQSLTLYCCSLKPPTTFEGFRNLKSLVLDHVTMAKDDFEKLISGSPLLEKLILLNLDGFTEINIHAPNIKFVLIVGKFEGISFDNSPQLAKVIVNLTSYLNSRASQSRLHGCSSNLVNFFDHLPNIQSLMIHSYFIKYLFGDVVQVKLPTPCINLTSLSVCANFKDLNQISAVLCLLKSSPNLQSFSIHTYHQGRTKSYCWEDTFSEPVMPLKLQRVTIEDIFGTKPELDLIRFILLYSPVLEKMTVKPFKNLTSELMTELIRFRRVSGQVEVIYQAKESS